MRTTAHYVLSFLIMGIASAASSQQHLKASGVPQCTPEMLDIQVLTEAESAPYSKGHLVAFEIRNRTQKSCAMVGLAITFPPDGESDETGTPWPIDSSPAAKLFTQKSNRLEPAEIVHFLLAWSSIPLNIGGLVMNNCPIHDTMAVAWHIPGTQKPFLEVRHLGIQACGGFYRSGYREGRYVPDELISTDWLQQRQLTPADVPMGSIHHPIENAATSTIRLHTVEEVAYLPGSFESAYSGYFPLMLSVPSPALPGCQFESLRKREEDGSTTVYLNHCEHHDVQESAPSHEMRLEFVMRPERTGRVEYEATAEVLTDHGPILAGSKVRLSIRDPNAPMLPVIDSSIPGCVSSQLKASPPLDLGGHWAQPWAIPPSGEQLYFGKVFQFTNVSSQNCRLGGTPQLKFLDAVPDTRLFLTVCRNCATDLFKPRESRWVDLKPNDSAHFIIARKVLDARYWSFYCRGMDSIEMSLPGDREFTKLPFKAGGCGQASVSAWRQGAYDQDPQNLEYDRKEAQRESARKATAQAIPRRCADEVSADTGTPVMLLSNAPLTWGVSTRPAHYGQPVSALLWIDNSSDQPQPVMTCMSIDSFWIGGIDIFDSGGHRVLSLSEQAQRKAGYRVNQTLSMCTRNFPIYIPPHTCTHTDFSTLDFDFSRDLREYYDLSPGRYFLVRGERTPEGEPFNRTVVDPANGLAVTVLEP